MVGPVAVLEKPIGADENPPAVLCAGTENPVAKASAACDIRRRTEIKGFSCLSVQNAESQCVHGLLDCMLIELSAAAAPVSKWLQ